MKWVKYIVIIGNVTYIFWIMNNGLDAGLIGPASTQFFAGIGIICLLFLNLVSLNIISDQPTPDQSAPNQPTK
jgi:hypothetical protein